MTTSKGGRPTLVDEETFIKSWNKNSGDARLVAKELNMKYNSAWVRGARLLKKHGVKNPGTNKVFEMRYEDMKK